jgi:GNAT superfamily N-acetyltransferase
MSGSEAATVIRRAKGEDVEGILDLLAHYDAPRSYFDPFYFKDPSYRPEHSWVAEQDGRFVAHLRVFDRKVRASGSELRVAGIGNVITAPDQRGRGHAGRLLRAVTGLSAALAEDVVPGSRGGGNERVRTDGEDSRPPCPRCRAGTHVAPSHA